MSHTNVTDDYSVFDPQAYLQEYYADLGAENLALLRFFVKSFREVPAGSRVLDFGAGPTVYAAIAASSQAHEIHISDYFQSNLDQVRQWLYRDPAALDWRSFTRAILELEGGGSLSAEIAEREEQTRQCITRLMHCDARSTCPIEQADGPYDVVMTNFCAEAAAHDREEWRQCMRNITSLLKPQGRLVVSAVKGACSYAVGETTFFAVTIRENDLFQVLLELGFAADTIVVESVPADRPDRHYEGLMFAAASKLS